MLKIFKQILQAKDGDNFHHVAKSLLQQLPATQLPLQQALRFSSHVSNSPFSVVILNCNEDQKLLKLKTAVFYQGIIAGCNCSDDPTPDNEENEYCEILFEIDKITADTTITLITD